MIGMTSLAGFLGLNVLTTYVLLLLIVGTIWYLTKKHLPKEKGKKVIVVSTIVLLGLFVVSGSQISSTEPSVDWQQKYVELANNDLTSYDSFIENTAYYDYDSNVISSVARNILERTDSSEEAVREALIYVYKNVDYIPNEPDSKCLDGSAPLILQSGKGQCDTQSIVLVSLLRKMGIAARPVGGCLALNTDCRLQSVFLNSGLEFLHTPKIQEPDVEGDTFSRAGGLHAWVVAWVPESGWLVLEPTNGLIADTNCYFYHVELLPTDSQKTDICISKNKAYAIACQQDDFTKLDEQGLGNVEAILND